MVGLTARHRPTLRARLAGNETTRAWSDRLFLALVATLPVHTVYARGVVAWKPWLILLIAVAILDLWSERRYPWSRPAVPGVVVFLVAILISWPGPDALDSFWRLFLALGAGILLFLVVGSHVPNQDRLLRVIFWSAAAMGASGFIFGLVTNGVFGESLVSSVNDIPGIDRINKPAYLGSGFVALTNWHQDPGYAALWANLWFVLAAFAWLKGAVRGPWWLGPAVLGGLFNVTVLTLSRTGWLGLAVGGVAVCLGYRLLDRERMRRALSLVGRAAVVGVLLVAIQMAVDPQGVGGDLTTALEFRVAYLAVLGAITVDSEEPGVIDPDRVVQDNRLEVWGEYWERFTEDPLRGIGLGTGWGETGFQEPHNLGLQLLSESGLIGLGGFVVLLAVIWAAAGKPDRVTTAVLSVLGLAALTQTVIFEPALWLVLGLWLAHVSNREAKTESAAVGLPPDPHQDNPASGR